MTIFDYDSLLAGATYRGTYVREPDPNSERNVSYVGKFLGISADQLLKISQDPDGKCRQVALLCIDDKYESAWRYFEPETLILVEDVINNG
jgi:hypothetical protein